MERGRRRGFPVGAERLSKEEKEPRVDPTGVDLERLLEIPRSPDEVAGILPRNHRTLVGFGWSPDLYMPVSRDDESVNLLARLPEGMSRQVAFARLRSACKELNKVYPRSNNSSWANEILIAPISGVERLQELGIVVEQCADAQIDEIGRAEVLHKLECERG